jgi:hypothetical protein
MRKLVYFFPLIILSILATSCTTSKQVSFLNVEELTAQKPPQVDLATYEEKYSEYDGVYLLLEETVEHSGPKAAGLMGQLGLPESWNYSHIYKEKALVLNPDCSWLTTLELRSLPDKLFIRITAPDGRTAVYGKSDMVEDKSKGGTYGYRFAYPDVTRGSIIETAYEYAYKVYPENFQYVAQCKVMLQTGLPCERVRFTYAYPEWWEIKIKRLGKDRTLDYETVVDSVNRKKQLVYEAVDVPQLTDEPYSPYFRQFAPYVDLMITNLSMIGGSYKNTSDWQRWANNFDTYLLRDFDKPAPAVKRIADSLVSENDSKLVRMKAVVGYIYANIGVGKDQHADCGDILKDREGTVYDITALAEAMLSAAGITSSFILVHDAQDGFFDEFYYSSDQLYVPALRVNIDGVDYVIFPYYKNLPVELIPENFLGQPALLIPPNNPDAAWIWTLPDKCLAGSATDEYYDVEVEPTGAINVTEKRILRGMMAYGYRRIFQDRTEDEIRDSLKTLLTYTDGDVDLDTYSILHLEDYDVPLEIELKYTIDNLVTITPDEVLFQTGGLFSPLSNRKIKFDADKRLNPICIHYEERYNKNITIRYPEGWRLATELTDVDFANDFGSISGVYDTEPGSIHAEQHLVFNKISAPKEEIGELMALAGSRSLMHVPTLIFNTSPGNDGL